MPTDRKTLAELHFDSATAQALGRRACQEDAIVTHFAQGTDIGFVVLADGMGGHAAGDVASKIVVTEVFSELMFQSADTAALQTTMAATLRDAAQSANACIAAYVAAHPGCKGMGATLVAPVLMGPWLWWISIGDSPLFLYRDGALQQLNEDHSLAPQIDFMAAQGLLDADLARDHPDRNVLTSVLFGQTVARIDCPVMPQGLQIGDILIVASDGLQFLDNDTLLSVLIADAERSSADIVRRLLSDLDRLDDPDQDNVSFCVIRVQPVAPDKSDGIVTWRRHTPQPRETARAR